MHSTSNLEDDYIGSGKRLWLSIRKHGKENHEKEILEWLPDRHSLKEREREIVNEEFLLDPMCMNLQVGGGGGGGWSSELAIRGGKKGGNRIREKIETDKEFAEAWSKQMTTRLKKMWKEGKFNTKGENNGFYGKTHTSDFKQDMSVRMSILQSGEKNSQYGKIWINDGKVAVKVKKEELEKLLSLGWKKGRKINLSH